MQPGTTPKARALLSFFECGKGKQPRHLYAYLLTLQASAVSRARRAFLLLCSAMRIASASGMTSFSLLHAAMTILVTCVMSPQKQAGVQRHVAA